MAKKTPAVKPGKRAPMPKKDKISAMKNLASLGMKPARMERKAPRGR